MPKLTVEFSDRVNEKLEEVAKRNELTKADILRRAIALYDFVDANVVNKDVQLVVTDKNGKVLKEIVVT
jgi:predicted transcriptional regulator